MDYSFESKLLIQRYLADFLLALIHQTSTHSSAYNLNQLSYASSIASEVKEQLELQIHVYLTEGISPREVGRLTIEQIISTLQASGQIFIQRIQKTQHGQNSQKGLLTQKIEAALRDHCGQAYSLDDLAHDLQRDKYYLAHLYKQETGQTINQYENSYRISRFKSMLLWTDQPITEIAAVLGFATPNYASRCFKKIVGIAPQQYRQRHQLKLLQQ